MLEFSAGFHAMPEPPDATEYRAELRLSEDLTTVELVSILEHLYWYRDNMCTTIRFDRGVRDYILRALKQRSASR
jgi:hypothetical protein